MSLMVPVVLS
jgi:hypothetical protein